MKGCVNAGTHGSKTGGDMGFAGVKHKVTPRNLRRYLKKYPDDQKIQELLSLELEKITYKGVE
jgi:hypothetical protein